jgi:hypothetical protein
MNPVLNNTLIYQTRQFHVDTEYLVVFRGGQGGNFLSTVLNAAGRIIGPTALRYHLDNTNIGSNEYHSSRGPVGNSHINLWFRQHENQRYRSEVYSVGAYRGILQLFKKRNIKLIVLNADYPLILYTELIGSIKAVNNGHHNDNNDLNQVKLSSPYNILHSKRLNWEIRSGNIDFYRGIVRHYQTLTKLATAYDIPHISIDYRDIFLDQNTDALVEFMDIPSENISALNDSIAHYTLQNNSLLGDLGLEFPA